MNKKITIILLLFILAGIVSSVFIIYNEPLSFNFGYQGWNNLTSIFDFPIKCFSVAFVIYSLSITLKKLSISSNLLTNSNNQISNSLKSNIENNAITIVYKTIDKIEAILDHEEPKAGVIQNLKNEIEFFENKLLKASSNEPIHDNIKKVLNSLNEFKDFLETNVMNEFLQNRILLTLLAKYYPVDVPMDGLICKWSEYMLTQLTLQFKILTYNMALLEKSELNNVCKFISSGYIMYLIRLKKIGLKIEDSAITYFYYLHKKQGSYPYKIEELIDSETRLEYKANLEKALKNV